MSIINKISMMLCIASTSLTSCEAQVKNAKTETVKIYGNCGMCEKTIETAGIVSICCEPNRSSNKAKRRA